MIKKGTQWHITKTNEESIKKTVLDSRSSWIWGTAEEGIKCGNLSDLFPSQRKHFEVKELVSHNRNLAGGKLSWWPQPFSISLSISRVITGASDGLFMTSALFLRDTLLQEERGAVSHFWHPFLPPISGPCHQWWPLWCSPNSHASCALSAPLGSRQVDWVDLFASVFMFDCRG